MDESIGAGATWGTHSAEAQDMWGSTHLERRVGPKEDEEESVCVTFGVHLHQDRAGLVSGKEGPVLVEGQCGSHAYVMPATHATRTRAAGNYSLTSFYLDRSKSCVHVPGLLRASHRTLRDTSVYVMRTWTRDH